MLTQEIAQAVRSQLIASLNMLKDCIDRCPEKEWNEKHNDYPFSQVVFHTLFDCDINMSTDENDLRRKHFHQEHVQEFGEYEELEDKIRNMVYKKDFIVKYYLHCIEKVLQHIQNETNDELILSKSDFYKSMTRLERYINCIRHTQHHTAQLGFRLQLLTKKEMDWIGKEAEL
jgi:hypothetical protein